MQETKQSKSHAGRERIIQITKHRNTAFLSGGLREGYFIQKETESILLPVFIKRGKESGKSPFHGFTVCFIGKRNTFSAQSGQKGS